MIVQIRKSIAGTEYWDTEKKRSIFVPKGQAPNFETTENPATMITPEGGHVIVAVDSSDGKDQTVVTELQVTDDGTVEVENVEVVEPADQGESAFDDMKVSELREYAKKNDIEIPAAIRAKGDIINLILNAE